MALILVDNTIIETTRIKYCVTDKVYMGGTYVDATRIYFDTYKTESTDYIVIVATPVEIYEKINKEVSLIHRMEGTANVGKQA